MPPVVRDLEALSTDAASDDLDTEKPIGALKQRGAAG
jgi:hypothetical protein